MFKKCTAILLAIVLVMGLVPATAFASGVVAEGTCGENVTWVLTEDGVLTISGEGEMLDYESQEAIPWVGLRESIVAIDVQNGITHIGSMAFGNCPNLTDVKISNSVTSIGRSAFAYSTSLLEIVLPDSITDVGDAIFGGCYKLESVFLSRSMTSVSSGMFTECYALRNIYIPDGITYFDWSAFWKCSSLAQLVIPSSVTYIEGYSFYYCDALTDIYYTGSESEWGAVTINEEGNECLFQADLTYDYVDNRAASICVGDYIELGTYMGETILWRCIGIDENGPLMLSDKIICFKAYDASGESEQYHTDPWGYVRKERGSNCWYDSSLRQWLNSQEETVTYSHCPPDEGSVTANPYADEAGFLTFFTEEELEAIRTVSHKVYLNDCDVSRGYSDGGSTEIPTWPISKYTSGTEYSSYHHHYVTDRIFLLSAEQIGMSHNNIAFYLDQANITEACANSLGLDYDSVKDAAYEYWTSIPCSTGASYENVVTGPSTLDSVSRANYGDVGVRPAFYLNAEAEVDFDIIRGEEIGKSESHDTLSELTTEDYLAFSVIAYKQFDSYGTVAECMTDKGYWDDVWHKELDISYAKLCANIANWKIMDVSNWSKFNGFYAVVFTNDQKEAVIAYRGSVPPTSMNSIFSWDFYCDWFLNDFPIELGNTMGPQLDSALGIYQDVIGEGYSPSRIAVTGHSLGGAWADTVSAYSGCKGVTFNAVSILDVLYKHDPERMSKMFGGADQWNFVDHTNQNDILAGMFEHYLSTSIKPYVAHTGNIEIKPDVLTMVVGQVIGFLFGGHYGGIAGGVIGGVGGDIAACHGMESLVMLDSDGNLALTKVSGRFTPATKITNYMLTQNHSVDLGTSGADIITEALTVLVPRTSYGGSGNDIINTSVQNDTIIGGPDHSADQLDGGWGDDTYIYYIGDGYDKIWDVSGKDTLEIYGAPSSADIDVVVNDETDMVDIYCDGELIVSIYSKNRHKGDNSFTILCNGGETNVTAELRTVNYSTSLRIGCPVHVEVLDADGNVVHTLTDGEVGAWYTDYGNFYVFEEESGEYGKVLDLVEGYTARIVGAGEGTMDVTYQVPVEGGLSEPVSISDVPVTDSLIAAVEENEDGDVYLVIDEDGDGETDTIRQLRGENPFTDVPEGSFYYESVMWAVENGVTNGLTETTFGPNEVCNRAQVVTFLWRANGSPEPTATEHSFVDVAAGSFYEKAVLWAVENGITTGTDATHFSPNAACNRATVVTFLHRAAGSPAPASAENPFADVDTARWYGNAVLWAVENGITNGLTADTFGPTTNCNRAQVVTFLCRAYTE